MRRKKVLFIVNPRSGKGQIRNALLDIADIFIKGGLDVTLYVTQKPQDASRVVEKRAAKFDLVACSGGDGTLDEVVTGMMNSEIRRPIGYIPAGSTNDFANSLQIPKRMTEAAQCMSALLTVIILYISLRLECLPKCLIRQTRMSKMYLAILLMF